MGGSCFGNEFKLFVENGFNLTVRSDGTILGTQDDSDPDVYLRRSGASDSPQECNYVRIQGLSTHLYVCFDKNGKLYAEADMDNEGTVFEETLAGSYNSYRSVAYPDWYLGIKRNGKGKPGPTTKYGRKSTKFLPRRWTPDT